VAGAAESALSVDDPGVDEQERVLVRDLGQNTVGVKVDHTQPVGLVWGRNRAVPEPAQRQHDGYRNRPPVVTFALLQMHERLRAQAKPALIQGVAFVPVKVIFLLDEE
jgi:hypothetical protein